MFQDNNENYYPWTISENDPHPRSKILDGYFSVKHKTTTTIQITQLQHIFLFFFYLYLGTQNKPETIPQGVKVKDSLGVTYKTIHEVIKQTNVL